MQIDSPADSPAGKRRLRILIAGGGTGGHLFPGLAIADEISRRRPEVEITFVGTKEKIEARVVPQRGYGFVPIWISGFRRKLTVSNLLFPLKVGVAIVQSLFLMKKFRPDVVIGTGGYVCGPTLFAAMLFGIPTLIQEQNSIPGVTTRLLAARATEVHLSFEMTRKALKRHDNVRVSGNPTFAGGRRTAAEGLRYFNLNHSKKTLLVFGGSLGATSINKAVGNILPQIRGMDIQIIWQTGDADFEEMKQRVGEMKASSEEPYVRVQKFIDEMPLAYAGAQLAVCRAGATTLAELTSLGVPAILIPYPFAAADHQRLNAAMMVQEGAAVMIDDDELNDRLWPTIKSLMDDGQQREEISKKAAALGKPNAAATLADAILEMVKV